MIGYNRNSGATAFFESSDQTAPWVTVSNAVDHLGGSA